MGEEEEEEEEEGEKCVRAFMRQLCIFFFFVSLPYICCTTKDFICKTCLDVYFSFVASR